MRLGGQCHDRIYHVDRSDEFDVTHFGFFLIPLLLLYCASAEALFQSAMS